MMNLATCAGFFACQACTDCLKATMKQQVRLSYILFNGFFIALAILIVYWLADLLNSTDFMMAILKDYIHCPADQGFSCLGISAVYRISLALVIFHFFILLFVLMRNGCSKVMNEEVWPFKILMVLVLFVALFFLSNEFFETYSTIAMIASLFFLVFQVVMIIDLFYLWGENWVSKYDQGSNFFMYALIIVALAIYGGVIYWVVKSFNWFGGCGIGTLANTVNIVFIVLDALIIFAGLTPNGSLLTTGAVSGYSTYLIWSGLSNMEESCNPLISEEFTTVFHMVFGLIVIVASLIYVSVGSSEKTSGQVAPGGVDIAKGLLADKTPMTHEMDYEEGIITRLKNHDLQVYQENSFIYFHLIMILAACYVAMLLSNWGSPVIGGQQFFQFQASKLSMWIKVGVAWTTMTLYTWTLIAPRLCPDRDFS